MKVSEYKSYKDLPLFLNAEIVSKVCIAIRGLKKCADLLRCWHRFIRQKRTHPLEDIIQRFPLALDF